MDLPGLISSLMAWFGNLAKLGLSTFGLPNWLLLGIIYAVLYVVWDQTVGQWTKPITILVITILIASFVGIL